MTAPLFTPEAVRKSAIAYLEEARPAVEGENGNDRSYRVALRMKDLGCEESDAHLLMMEHWNDSCDPPWDEMELRQIVHNAYRYGKRPAAVDSVVQFATQDIPDEDKIIQIGAFLAPPPKREWVVADWIPKGTAVLLAGEGGVGKSAVLMQLCVCVATGMPWLGLTVQCPMQTLYVACEDPKDELHRRFHAMCKAPEIAMLDVARQPIYAFSRVGLESRLLMLEKDGRTPRTGGFMAVLEKQVVTSMAPGPKLIVLDTVPDTFGGNENDRSQVNYFSKTILGRLIREHQCTVVCNAHPAKAEGSEYSGSTAWNGAFRARLQMSYHPDGEDYRTLDLRKSNYSRAKAQVVLRRGEDGVFRTATTEDALAEACAAVYRAVERAAAIGVWLAVEKVKGHSLAHYEVKCGNRELTEAQKLDAAKLLLQRGLLREEREGKSMKLVTVTLEEALQ